MSWGMIGGAAVSVVGGSLLKGGSGTGSSSSAQAADPFSNQRYQYQPMLQTLVNGGSTPAYDATAQAAMGSLASGQGVNSIASTNLAQASGMLSPGYNFTTQDPEYQAMMDAGSQTSTAMLPKQGSWNPGTCWRPCNPTASKRLPAPIKANSTTT
jgi:hypothetical protein